MKWQDIQDFIQNFYLKEENKMAKFIGSAVAIIVFCAFIYGSYWVTKNGSYWFFYEDMVKSTIQEAVKQDSLKGE